MKCGRDDGGDRWTKAVEAERELKEILPKYPKTAKWPRPGLGVRDLQSLAIEREVKKHGSQMAWFLSLQTKEKRKTDREVAIVKEVRSGQAMVKSWAEKMDKALRVGKALMGG